MSHQVHHVAQGVAVGSAWSTAPTRESFEDRPNSGILVQSATKVLPSNKITSTEDCSFKPAAQICCASGHAAAQASKIHPGNSNKPTVGDTCRSHANATYPSNSHLQRAINGTANSSRARYIQGTGKRIWILYGDFAVGLLGICGGQAADGIFWPGDVPANLVRFLSGKVSMPEAFPQIMYHDAKDGGQGYFTLLSYPGVVIFMIRTHWIWALEYPLIFSNSIAKEAQNASTSTPLGRASLGVGMSNTQVKASSAALQPLVSSAVVAGGLRTAFVGTQTGAISALNREIKSFVTPGEYLLDQSSRSTAVGYQATDANDTNSSAFDEDQGEELPYTKRGGFPPKDENYEHAATVRGAQNYGEDLETERPKLKQRKVRNANSVRVPKGLARSQAQQPRIQYSTFLQSNFPSQGENPTAHSDQSNPVGPNLTLQKPRSISKTCPAADNQNTLCQSSKKRSREESEDQGEFEDTSRPKKRSDKKEREKRHPTTSKVSKPSNNSCCPTLSNKMARDCDINDSCGTPGGGFSTPPSTAHHILYPGIYRTPYVKSCRSTYYADGHVTPPGSKHNGNQKSLFLSTSAQASQQSVNDGNKAYDSMGSTGEEDSYLNAPLQGRMYRSPYPPISSADNGITSDMKQNSKSSQHSRGNIQFSRMLAVAKVGRSTSVSEYETSSRSKGGPFSNPHLGSGSSHPANSRNSTYGVVSSCTTLGTDSRAAESVIDTIEDMKRSRNCGSGSRYKNTYGPGGSLTRSTRSYGGCVAESSAAAARRTHEFGNSYRESGRHYGWQRYRPEDYETSEANRDDEWECYNAKDFDSEQGDDEVPEEQQEEWQEYDQEEFDAAELDDDVNTESEEQYDSDYLSDGSEDSHDENEEWEHYDRKDLIAPKRKGELVAENDQRCKVDDGADYEGAGDCSDSADEDYGPKGSKAASSKQCKRGKATDNGKGKGYGKGKSKPIYKRKTKAAGKGKEKPLNKGKGKASNHGNTKATKQARGKGLRKLLSAESVRYAKGGGQKKRSGWSEYEHECLRTLVRGQREAEKAQKIPENRWLKDIGLFDHISKMMMSVYGLDRSLNACKNAWNREGRAEAGFDERARPTGQLACSVQRTKRNENAKAKKTKVENEESNNTEEDEMEEGDDDAEEPESINGESTQVEIENMEEGPISAENYLSQDEGENEDDENPRPSKRQKKGKK